MGWNSASVTFLKICYYGRQWDLIWCNDTFRRLVPVLDCASPRAATGRQTGGAATSRATITAGDHSSIYRDFGSEVECTDFAKSILLCNRNMQRHFHANPKVAPGIGSVFRWTLDSQNSLRIRRFVTILVLGGSYWNKNTSAENGNICNEIL